MSSPTIRIFYNNSEDDIENNYDPVNGSGWKLFDPVNDKISFQGDSIDDGDPINSKSVFRIPESGQAEIPQQLIGDYVNATWNKVFLAGSNADSGGGGNNRYVYAAEIEGKTSSPPVLQAWDSIENETYSLAVLGGGVPANSMLRAIATTTSSPGELWEGTPLAGDSVENSVILAINPAAVYQTVYWNMRLVIPSTAVAFAVTPALCIYFTYS